MLALNPVDHPVNLKAAGLDLNRKALAEVAFHDEAAFKQLVDAAKAALEKA